MTPTPLGESGGIEDGNLITMVRFDAR